MAELCSGKGKTIRHRHWQWFRMPCPCKQNLFSFFAETLSYRHHVGQCLTGVMHCGFEIDNGLFCVTGKRAQNWICPLLAPVLKLGKCPDADRGNVSFENMNKFF